MMLRHGSAAPILIVILFVLICVGAGIVAIVMSSGEEQLPEDPNAAALAEVMAEMTIPSFEAVNQNGDAITRDTFLGQHTILSFGFTYCTTVCPIMHGQMYRLQEALAQTPARFMLFSVDPQHDTPERLREYAEQLGADTARWDFIVADIDTLHAILIEGLGFALDDDPTVTIQLPDGSTMNNISHPSRFLLVGPEGNIIDMCRGTDPTEVDRFGSDLVRRLR
ncbi:MAG: SCO family protein [Planctomycetota bacterium]